MDPISKKPFVIHTDGACSGNPGPGGWGASILSPQGALSEISGFEKATTNNRMELLAIIRALESIPAGSFAQIFTDSQYAKNGMTQWIKGWKRNGWKSSSGGEVKNRDLWESLDRLCSQTKAEWHWVRGHNGHEGNERADALAREACQKARRG